MADVLRVCNEMRISRGELCQKHYCPHDRLAMFQQSKAMSGAYAELRMTVAVQLLSGVLPELDFLHGSIKAGGGVIESMKKALWI